MGVPIHEVPIVSRLLLTVAVVPLAAILLTAADPPKKVELPADYDTADLSSLFYMVPQRVEWKKDAKTGFVVGGDNKTELIRTLTEINGRKIADLEADMRPGAPVKVGSTAGFLGKDEKLLDVLAADNDTVLKTLGLTHREIGRELNILGGIAKWRMDETERDDVKFLYRERRFKATVIFWKGDQLSPFKDGTKTSNDMILENLDTGKKLSCSLLVPLMIERYGFYEGKGTKYRVDPVKVVDVLDFLKPVKK